MLPDTHHSLLIVRDSLLVAVAQARELFTAARHSGGRLRRRGQGVGGQLWGGRLMTEWQGLAASAGDTLKE